VDLIFLGGSFSLGILFFPVEAIFPLLNEIFFVYEIFFVQAIFFVYELFLFKGFFSKLGRWVIFLFEVRIFKFRAWKFLQMI
jgi:hypothetical protein